MSTASAAAVAAGQGLLPPPVRRDAQCRLGTFAEHPFKLLHHLVTLNVEQWDGRQITRTERMQYQDSCTPMLGFRDESAKVNGVP